MNVTFKLIRIWHSLEQLIELGSTRCIHLDAVNRDNRRVHADAVNNAAQPLQFTDGLTRWGLIRCLLQM